MLRISHSEFGLPVLPYVRVGTLPLSAEGPRAPPHGAVAGALPVLDEHRRGTKLIELGVRSVLNPPESTGMGFWSFNPYVGCEFGCAYCYARYAHRYVVERSRDKGVLSEVQVREFRGQDGWEGFENRIFVKERATVLAALERDLAKLRRRAELDGAQNLTIGTATDPYQPAERQYQVTRTVLERLGRERGLRIGIITKSSLICRDLDVLKELANAHLISVYVSLISTDVRVIKRYEARSPMPHARLRTLRKLTAAGIRAGLIVAPILPGVTDSDRQIDALMRSAKEAGAKFVFPVPLRLYPAVKERLLPIIDQHDAELGARYRASYGQSWSPPNRYVQALKRRFARTAKRYGIPTSDSEQEQPPPDKLPEQLTFF